MKGYVVAAIAAALGLAGCATTMQGSAPAREGFVYAVGSESNQPHAWICPVPKGGECQSIKVVED